MPKLRKHSQLQQSKAEPENSNASQSTYSRRPQESKSLLSIPPIAGKKKFRDRITLATTNVANPTSETEQTTSVSVSVTVEGPTAKDSDIDNYLSKFKDDDDDSIPQLNSTHIKKKKAGIRVSNKFFSDHIFEEMEELTAEQLELVIERKEAKDPEHLLAKVERRAEGFKNRLDFKSTEHGQKLKRDMKHKLKSIESCQEVKLVIEVPQVAAANKHIDGALFLKNVKTSSPVTPTPNPDRDPAELPKERKLYYENLSKQMKMKRVESITESALKECFKKSRLDNDDFLSDFHRNQGQFQETAQLKKERELRENQSEANLEKAASYSPSVKQTSEIQSCDKPQKKQLENITPNISTQQTFKERPVKKSEDEVQSSIAAKPQQKKQRRRGKAKKFNIKDLIEEEAEDSDEDDPRGKPKGNNQSDEEDDDEQVTSLIDDNDVPICAQEQELVHRKFINDMIEVEEQNFARFQKKMFEQQRQFKDQDEKLKQRMEAASKRNASKESEKVEQHVESNVHPPSEPSEESISHLKNLEKLKQLEVELGIQKPKPSSQSNAGSDHNTVNKTLLDFERLITHQVADVRKPISSGLKNVERFKFKSNSRPKPKPMLNK